jgi:FkbM family methyltransferase
VIEQGLADAIECRLGAAGRERLLARFSDLRRKRWRRPQERRLAGAPRHINHFESRRHSQNGEDGILAEIFRRIGITDRRFVEIGAGDGTENCTRELVAEGFGGVWIEGDAVAAARARATALPGVTVVGQRIDRDNLLPLLAAALVPAEPDLVVIDVDGNDYWLWRELAAGHRPRVVVVEYNASYRPGACWVMPYDAAHRWDGSRHFGASLEALVGLGRDLGYRLVGCDRTGVNAFFVRDGIAAGFDGDGSAEEHYWPPQYGDPWFGHPPRRAAPPPPAVDLDGLRLELDPHGGVITRTLLDSGTWERFETEVFLGELRPGDTVVDVGANVGYYTLLGARRVGATGRVFAFEPDPGNFALLGRNVGRNRLGNVVIEPKAVSDRGGRAALFRSGDNAGDHRLYDSKDGRASVAVETVALDEYFAVGLERIDLIKIDIQGAEASALAGMRELIRRNRHARILLEFWPIGLVRCGAKPRDLLDELRRADYVLFNLDDDTATLERIERAEALLDWHPPEQESFTNLLCVPREALGDWEQRHRFDGSGVHVEWIGGFHRLERDGLRSWRWCGPEGKVRLSSHDSAAREVEIEMDLVSGAPSGASKPSALEICSELLSYVIEVSEVPAKLRRTFVLPPGVHEIAFSCAAPAVRSAVDPRCMVFRVEGFSLRAKSR